MESLRRRVREQRRALGVRERAAAAAAVAQNARPLLSGAKSLGAYVAVAGEVDPAPIVAWAWEQAIPVYVPRITAGPSMVFAPWRPGAEYRIGTFGVPEPIETGGISAAGRLAVVLVPLVAFDRRGTRVGTGAGFYDRAFAFRRKQPRGSAPLLVGLAYSWQEQPSLEPKAWDVALDYVVTEREVIHATPG